MAAPLQGLTGLYGPTPAPGSTGEGRLEAAGGPVDPRHRIPGESSGEEPYTYTAYPGEDLAGEPPAASMAPGAETDRTPTTHAGGYPRGVDVDPAAELGELARLHGVDTGGPAMLEAPTPYPETIRQRVDLSPNASELAGVPRQLAGGRDVDQGSGTVNSYGFDHGRRLVRAGVDPVPGNHQLLHADERPFRVRQAGGNAAVFNGPDSPYGPTADNQGLMTADPVGYPTAYAQPPDPTVLPTSTPAGEDIVTDFGFVAG